MKSRRVLISIIGIMAFVMMFGGISYAYFIYNNDVVDVSLETGGMQVTYTSGNTMNLDGAIPMNDNLGEINPYYIDFSITGVTDTEDIYYEIYLTPKDGNTINPKYVKTYLTDQSNNNQHGACAYSFLKNSTYNTNGKVIYSNIFFHNIDDSKKTTTKKFRLRVWLDEEYNNFTSQNFAFDVKVYAQNIKINMMNTFPTEITDEKANIKEIYFNSESQDIIDSKYNAATIKADLTYNTRGSVKAWLEPDTQDNTKYIMYIESDGETYLYTGAELFKNFTALEDIYFNNLNTLYISSMTGMFEKCSSLTELDLSSFNTINVTYMRSTFNGCRSIVTINLTDLEVSNVTDMWGTFNSCVVLENIDLSKWNTGRLTSLRETFYGCYKLKVIDVSSFSTRKVTSFYLTFNGCNTVTVLDVSHFDTSKANGSLGMSNMFNGCNNVAVLDVSHFDVSKVTSLSTMFGGCRSLTSLDLSSWNTSKVSNFASMFKDCTNLVSLDLSNWNTISLTNFSSTFENCSSLLNLDLSSFNTSNVTTFQKTFSGCTSLTTIYASELWSLASNGNGTSTFLNCTSLVGGSGTTYNSGYTHASDRAKIDNPPDNRGYFTYKAYSA